MLTATAFTKNIYWFLIEQEYTHIYLKGVSDPGKDDDFYIVPLKQDDDRLTSTPLSESVVALDDPATLGLTDPQSFINIMIEWPLGDYAAFLIQNTQ